ncbi:LLM class flavin-dependent oxidoreductase [uncultured Jatrophihabitans sp.]|uniref:LLM class flavin-dependent oxidoreductase n=1 Tax=uncultured Jatrophihabitans sp. TaxID=1610747 RepID=UPI0035CB70CC
MAALGVIFPPSRPPEELLDVARAADDAGVDELWLWEDCFAESGVGPAGAALAATTRIAVGIGLLPAPLRNVALTAMELATLARMFPGRLRPGIGHGVLDWMGQAGVRAASPMTLLEEHAVALRALLAGAAVTTAGRYVSLDDVRLAWPPVEVPPLLIGAVGPKTLELAGRLGDGVILTGEASAEALPATLGHVARGRAAGDLSGPVEVVSFLTVEGDMPASQIAAAVDALAAAGATAVAVLAVGDASRPLTDFARLLGEQVRPLLRG